MIRRGKKEGWLALTEDAFLPWAKMNDVSFDHTVPATITGRGRALQANRDLNEADEDTVLLTVPKDLVLSLERIKEHAKADQDFKKVLDSLNDFGQVGDLLYYHFRQQ